MSHSACLLSKVLRRVFEAQELHEESAAGVEISTLFFGREDEIGRVRQELARMHTARPARLRLVGPLADA